jgi:hypothetical protein
MSTATLTRPRPAPIMEEPAPMTFPSNLDEYLGRWGGQLAKQAALACEPLHTPGKDEIDVPDLLRKPFPAQQHVITAGIKALREYDAIQISAQVGTGKTIMSQAICHGHAAGPYRAMVFCPPHLVQKWAREIKMTVPNAHVHIVHSYRDLTRVIKTAKPFGFGWWVMSNTTAKLGPAWKPVYRLRGWDVERYNKRINMDKTETRSKLFKGEHILCPHCFTEQTVEDKETGEWIKIPEEKFHKKKRKCVVCGEAMWTWINKPNKWPAARYIHAKLRNFFDYAVIDESHQAKSAEAAIGQAMGSLVAGCRKTIALTGTLLGGYAWHVRPLLFRIAPQRLIDEGLGYHNETAFNERYGRLERKVTEKESKGGSDNKQSRGSSTKTVKYVRPGVMPQLFGRHLLERTIFLSLEEVAENLPPLQEIIVPCQMDAQQAEAYVMVEERLRTAVKAMLQKRDKRLLSKMLQTLLGYPDHPWGWGEIGYWDEGEGGGRQWKPIVTPPNLSQQKLRPKEQELINTVKREVAEGRQCWVYCVMTDTRDVTSRLVEHFRREGLRADCLRSSVETCDREEWIAKNGPNLDVCVSHPQLVETGLDLFAPDGKHNFCSLLWYQEGYSIFTLRQASGRAWRIGQKKDCRTYYFYYNDTMQARAMTLMGKKLTASTAIEGKFSSEGLAAMAGDEGALEMALAKSLAEKLDDLDVGRTWEKLGAGSKVIAPAPQPLAVHLASPPEETTKEPPKPAKAPERASQEADLPFVPSPNDWLRPKSGTGLSIKVVEVYGGRFVDFCEFGSRKKQTLALCDLVRLYQPMPSPGSKVVPSPGQKVMF